MKPSRNLLPLPIGLLLVFILAACNLPVRSPTPFVFPTIDLTRTVVFNPTVTVPLPVTEAPTASISTATPSPISNTPAPTSTSIPPSATLPPPPTWTNIPPTNTSVPPTATIPVSRTNSFAVAPFVSTAPTIDGSWNDLPSSSERPANFLVYRNPNFTGQNDLGMSYRIAWDNTYLYIGVKVGDSTYDQNSTGQYIFQGDSVEVLVDTKVSDDYYYNVLSPDDFQLGISPGLRTIGTNPEAYLWFPKNIAGSRANVKIAAISPSPSLYRIEFAIPWSILGVTPFCRYAPWFCNFIFFRRIGH